MSDKDEATRLADALEPVAVVYWSDIGHISWRSNVMLPDGTQLYAAPPDQSERIAALEAAVAEAYGHLWHVNNEPGAPAMLYSPGNAAYAARKLLRELLTKEQRGEGINKARAAIAKATGGAS